MDSLDNPAYDAMQGLPKDRRAHGGRKAGGAVMTKLESASADPTPELIGPTSNQRHPAR